MDPRLKKPGIRKSGGFTLAEACMAVLVVGMLAVICFTGMLCARVASVKARQQNIVNDFLLHYMENIKALPFPGTVPGVNVVASGSCINLLWNGLNADPDDPTGSPPNIVIPPSGSTNSLNVPGYLAWHPDLQWISNANPTIQVTLTTNWITISGTQVQHDIHVDVVVAWDPLLGYGSRQQCQLDIVRTKDL